MRKLFRIFFFLSFSGLAVAIAGAAGLWYTLWPTLPAVASLRDVELQTPLRVYTRDGKLMREFGEKRRVPLTIDQIPEAMTAAVIATEDRNFYRHMGVDPAGIARAVLYIIREGRKGPGGSTITMQVARNFFLDRGKTYTRKLTEIMLAIKIEQELGKGEILELYLNKIFLGHRSYGVGAAAQVYYGKRIEELSLPQIAMIAGLPQRPSDFNPITSPTEARTRRDWVLWRMHKEGLIDAERYAQARDTPLSASLHGTPVEADAPYVAEMVRQEVKRRFGETVFNKGYRITTTVDSRLQAAAVGSLRKALIDYDRRHGWRGAELKLDLGADLSPAHIDRLLADLPSLGGLHAAVVLGVEARAATVYVRRTGTVRLEWPALEWARSYINENRRGKPPKKAADILSVGDVVRVEQLAGNQGADAAPAGPDWRLAQLPAVEGALVALDPMDGAIVALAGGFDFKRSKFNRVVQAERQPGSSFKPFIYSAALEKGYTAASTINDAPVVFDDEGLESAWRPENYSGKFYGPTRLRWALTKSRNLVSIRLLQSMGIRFAMKHFERFSIDVEKLPRDLSISLGSGVITPLQLATGYTVLANGGYKVSPHFIARVEESDGGLVERTDPLRVCRECDVLAVAGSDTGGGQATPLPPPAGVAPRTLAADNAWLMYSMMGDVIRRGTATKALALKRSDLAGKTGTTNDQRDAWFSGYNGALVATAWVGFDRVRPLGRRETGGQAALPMWIDFMGQALKGVPETPIPRPEELISVRIDPETGLLAETGDPDAIYETFRPDLVPGRNGLRSGGAQAALGASVQKEAARVSEQLF